jgi:hypothetical protein
MDYILIFREGDKNVIEEYTEWFFKKTTKELVELYNQEVRKGITGVHRQALYLYALKQVYLQRFGVSPISLVESVLSMGKEAGRWLTEIPEDGEGSLVHDFGKITYVDKEKLKVVFSSMIIRVDSICKYFGSLKSFLESHPRFGVTNGKLLVMAEMNCPPHYLIEFAEDVLMPSGMRVLKDFTFANDQLVYALVDEAPEHHIHPIPECEDIPWLGSVVSRKDCFVWRS